MCRPFLDPQGLSPINKRITTAEQALYIYSLRQQGAIAQDLGIHTLPRLLQGLLSIKSDRAFQIIVEENQKAVCNETARNVLQVHQRTIAGVCRAELGLLTIKAYRELKRQAVIRHAERQDGHFQLLEEISLAREEEGKKKESK